MPLSTYLLRLICISGAFSLSTSPLRSQNLRKDIPTASMGSIGYTVCTVTSMRDCTEVSDSHAGTNQGCQIFFLVDSARVSRQTNYCRVLKKGPESVFLQHKWVTIGYSRIKPNTSHHRSLRLDKHDATVWSEWLYLPCFGCFGRCSQIYFCSLCFLFALALYTDTCTARKSEQKSFRETSKVLCDSALCNATLFNSANTIRTWPFGLQPKSGSTTLVPNFVIIKVWPGGQIFHFVMFCRIKIYFIHKRGGFFSRGFYHLDVCDWPTLVFNFQQFGATQKKNESGNM
jgi:hypothetical protein